MMMRYVEIEYELWFIRADHTVDMILLLRSFHFTYDTYLELLAYWHIILIIRWHMLELLSHP